MSNLESGSVITGTDAPTIVTSGAEGTNQSPTSTTYAAGTSCGVAFIAPTTGRVLLQWRAFVENDTGGAFTLITAQVREGSSVGSGTIILAASDEFALIHEGQQEVRYGMFYPLDGLTPGSNYNVQLLHRVTGGTGTLDDREVNVMPLT